MLEWDGDTAASASDICGIECKRPREAFFLGWFSESRGGLIEEAGAFHVSAGPRVVAS